MTSDFGFWSFFAALTALFSAGIVSVAEMAMSHGTEHTPALFISLGCWAILIGLAWSTLLHDATGDLGPLNMPFVFSQFIAVAGATIAFTVPWYSPIYQGWLPITGATLIILIAAVVAYGAMLSFTMSASFASQNKYQKWRHRHRKS